MKDEALRLALEALGEFERAGLATLKTIDAITAIKQALEETPCVSPEPEPVAWMNKHGACMSAVFKQVDETAGEYTTPLYTSPPKHEPLTDEEIADLWDGHVVPVFGKNGINPIVFARAIEAAHGIKGEA